MSAPTNEQMAHECLHSAERATSQWKANTEGMAAQTYATLALVDELRFQRGIHPKAEAVYVVADSHDDALTCFRQEVVFDKFDQALELLRAFRSTGRYHIYRVSVEVVQE